MAAGGRAGLLTLFLLIAAVGLAVLAARPWLRGPAPLPAASAGAGTSAAATDPIALPELPPFERFVETQRRPLFVATRRPPPVAAGPAPPPPSFDRGRIAGVVVIGDTKVALIRDPRSGKVQRVGEGETVDGWTVRAISTERLTMVSERGGAALEIELDRSAPPRR